MMGKKLERIEKIGFSFFGWVGVGEGGVPKRSKTHHSSKPLKPLKKSLIIKLYEYRSETCL